MQLTNNDYNNFPKFRHNLWTSYHDNPKNTYLIVSDGTYEVPTDDANRFLKIRAHCTGHNSIAEIAKKSNLPACEVQSIVTTMREIDILHRPIISLETVSQDKICNTLLAAVSIWAEQLADTHISRDIFLGKTSKNVVIGWLLETYHYVKQFPYALEIAATQAEGELKKLLTEYCAQEKGHEYFILETLMRAGLSEHEIQTSIPLVSTRCVDLLFRELFSLSPAAVLLLAGIIEAEDFDKEAAGIAANNLSIVHGFPLDMFDPFFKHVEIDSNLGHQALLFNNTRLLKNININQMHDIVNKLHDIKHAFDLQKLEINEYYNKQGNYLPRQFVDFFAI